MFTSVVTDFWIPERRPVPTSDSFFHVIVDGTVEDSRAVTTLDVIGGPRIVTLAPDHAERLGLLHGTVISDGELILALEKAGIPMNGPDHLFYLPADQQVTLRAEAPADGTRRLTSADAAAFELFTSAAPPDDLDEAFVELDHWLVYGTFANGLLVAAASMYPWADSRLADLGVITLPSHRGHGYARRTVRAISAHALAEGCEPQYRCQIDNAPSVALARAAGFERFGQWDVIAPE